MIFLLYPKIPTFHGKGEVNRNLGDRVLHLASVNATVDAFHMLDCDADILLCYGGDDLEEDLVKKLVNIYIYKF